MKTKYVNTNRRDFLRTSIVGATGLCFLPELVKGKSQKKMICRTLGRTGLKVPVVGIGCYTTSNAAVLKAALDAGIAYIDTAPNYGQGNSENMLGKVLKGRPRDSFVIATKHFGYRDSRTGLVPKQINIDKFKSGFQRSIQGSLKRLKLDYIDVFSIHGVVHPALVKDPMVMETLLELKKSGKTRFLGVSIHQEEPPLIRSITDAKIYDVILTPYNFRQPNKLAVEKAIEYAVGNGIGIVAMKVMAGVHWDRERKYPINAKAALKWVLKNKNIHTSVPGITTFNQLELDLSVMEGLTLTLQEKEDLKLGEKRGMAGLYCGQCGACQHQCRYQLDIPTLMRCYMYAYGYGSLYQAKQILDTKKKNDIFCQQCSECAVTCTMGFNVKEKCKDILRVLQIPAEFLA